jgi:PAS domain S-box-containing protein
VRTILLFAAAFCVLQRLTFLLRFPPVNKTTVWTPAALFFTALLLAPPRRWWVYFVGVSLGVFAALYEDKVVPVVFGMVGVPFYGVVLGLGAWWIRRLDSNAWFGNLKVLTAFVLIAVVVVPTVDQTLEVVIRVASGADDAWSAVAPTYLCIALGMLIATPAFTLTLANGRAWLLASSWKRFAEIAALAAGLVAVGYFSFWMTPGNQPLLALLFAPLPLLLWAAIRFELAGVSWALLLVALQSTWGAVLGRGPFASHTPADSVLQLQLFLLAISLPLLFLATVIRERRQAFSDLSRAEREVHNDYAQLATIYHSAPVGLAFVDTQLRYVSINDHLAEINGRPADAHLGRTVRQVLPVLADTIEPILRRVIATGQPVIELELQGATTSRPGNERSWLVSYYPVHDSQGEIFGVTTVVQEITDRKQAEEARQELAHASRLTLVGELTASIAHEINQPLGAILSYADAAELLLESAPESITQVRRILEYIRRDDLRANEVIKRLRALLRKDEVKMQPVDVNDLVSDVLLLIRAESRRRHVNIDSQFAANLPVVQGDKVHLQQVVLNLLLNGMDAMADLPGEKVLTVCTALNQDGCVEIAISDVGVGIPQHRFPRLFEPFFSTKKNGMGLGLSLSRSLIEAHGGRIWAENNSGAGATFRLALPIDGMPADRGSRNVEKAAMAVSV